MKHDVERCLFESLNSRIPNALIDFNRCISNSAPAWQGRAFAYSTMGHAPWRVWRCLVKTYTKNANLAISKNRMQPLVAIFAKLGKVVLFG
jgi:hypothetical protein